MANKSEGLSDEDRGRVRAMGHRMANGGYLKGDISEEYKILLPELVLKISTRKGGTMSEARRSGRTTGMLIEMAEYLHENYDKEELVVLVSHTYRYSEALLRKLSTLLPFFKNNPHEYRCGKIIIRLEIHDHIYDRARWTGTGIKTIFTDHYYREEVKPWLREQE